MMSDFWVWPQYYIKTWGQPKLLKDIHPVFKCEGSSSGKIYPSQFVISWYRTFNYKKLLPPSIIKDKLGEEKKGTSGLKS